MGAFKDQLEKAQPRKQGKRRWLYVPYDQLSSSIGPLSREPAGDLGIVLVESPWKAARRPYHQQKLALVLAAGRHFALEQARRGVAVRHLIARGSYAEALAPLVRELGPLRVMRPAERELRADLAGLFQTEALLELPHEGFLTTRDQFNGACPRPPFRMDAFYRRVRKDSGILMEGGKYAGGKVSHDAENRKAWSGTPPAPALPRFALDPIKKEVLGLIGKHYAHHPGTLSPHFLPATLAEAEALWQWALTECLRDFGPFEDAMSTRSASLFHTRVSGLLNLHRLLPARLVADVAALEIPLPSKEGFIRQILGWREYVHHVHEATDGFRQLPKATETVRTPGDGGYRNWAGKAFVSGPSTSARTSSGGPDGGARPSALGAAQPVPPAYWGKPSGLHCLDTVVKEVWQDAYSHHITRLMILGNLAMLLELSPRDLTDWFWVAYLDAYDWVVEPNVLGMGTWGIGELMVTKPYISGAAYIDRMSDYCAGCKFDPKKDCPITPMYWAFLARHDAKLAGNQRLKLPLAAARKRSPAQREADRATFERVSQALQRGQELEPPG